MAQKCVLEWQHYDMSPKDVILKKEKEFNNGGVEHTLIQGENLDVLQELLRQGYKNKIDCIYIDPPYNTGATNWRYNNGYGRNNDRHSYWLSFMEARLILAKELLNKENSVLICAIGEDEVHRLALLLGEIFHGAEIHEVHVAGNSERKGRNFIEHNEFYFFVQIGSIQVNPIQQKRKAKHSDIWQTLLRTGVNRSPWDNPNNYYPIYIDECQNCLVGEKISPDVPISEVPKKNGLTPILPLLANGEKSVWRYIPSSLQAHLISGRARVNNNKVEVKTRKYWEKYLNTPEEEMYALKTPSDIWGEAKYNAGAYGTNMIKAFLGGRQFDYAKSLYAVKEAIQLYMGNKKNATILDFFAGSGTTCHAVMELNEQDGGERKCISITNNENKICEEVTFPRIKNAISGKTSQGEKIKGTYLSGRPYAEGYKASIAYYIAENISEK